MYFGRGDSHDRAPGVEGAKGALPRTGMVAGVSIRNGIQPFSLWLPSGADLLFIEHLV